MFDIRWIIALIGLMLLAPYAEVQSAERPQLKAFTAHYQLMAKGAERGEAQITLTAHDDGSMTFAQTAQINKGWVSVAGARTEMRTRFTPQKDHLRLLNYHVALKHLAGSKSFDTVYHHDQGMVAVSSGDIKKHHAERVAFPPKAINPNVMSLALGLDWMQRGDSQQSFDYQLVDRGRLKQETYTFEPAETLTLPIGTLNAVKARSDEPAGNEDFVWYSERYGYIPVRLMQMRDGKVEMDLQLLKVEWPSTQAVRS